MTPQTKGPCEQAIRELPRPVQCVVLDDECIPNPASELRFLIRGLRTSSEDWLVAPLPGSSTFFEAESFEFAFASAVEKRRLVTICGPWPGWEFVLLHRAVLPKLEELLGIDALSGYTQYRLQDVLAFLKSDYVTLNDAYRKKASSRPGRPLDTQQVGTHLESTFGSTLRAYRKLTAAMNVTVSELNAERVSKFLESSDTLAGTRPEAIWLEVSAVNDVPPIYSPPSPGGGDAGYPPYMPSEIFERIFRMLLEDVGMGRDLHLSGLGEPLQNPQFLDVLKMINNKAAMPSLLPWIHCYTDGRFLTEQVAEEMLRGTVTSLMISLDAVDEMHYTLIRPLGSFQTVKQNVDRFLELKRRSPRMPMALSIQPIVALTTTLIAELENHIDAFMNSHMTWRKWQSRLGKNFTVEQYLGSQQSFYAEGHMVEHLVIQGASTYAGRNPDRRLAVYTPLKRFACRRLLSTIFIKTNGDIVVCDRVFKPVHDVVVGNVMQFQSFQDIWDCLAAHRAFHREGRYERASELCTKCEDWFIPVN